MRVSRFKFIFIFIVVSKSFVEGKYNIFPSIYGIDIQSNVERCFWKLRYEIKK